MSSKTKLDWAFDALAKGYAVFPIAQGRKKPPLLSRWQERASTDPIQVAEWWAEWPEANIGVVAGANRVIVDLDIEAEIEGKVYKKGKQGLQTLCEALGLEDWDVLSQTLTVRTASGGYQLHFASETPFAPTAGLLNGIDIRGSAGYGLWAGSVLDGTAEDEAPGPYTYHADLAIAPLPVSIAVLLSTAKERDENAQEPLFELDLPGAIARAREWLTVRDVAVEGEGGNNHTYATVAQLKDFCLSDLTTLKLLLEDDGWNDRCLPPWDDADLANIVENVYVYGKHRPGEKGGIMEVYAPPAAETDSVDEIEAHIAKVLKEETEAQRKEIEGLDEITYDCEDDYGNRPLKRETVIREWLPAHGMTGILAIRGTGKTICMLDVGLHIACDMNWHGLETQKDWAVVYVCGEDSVGAMEMREAWCLAYKRRPDKGRFIFIDGMPNIVNAEDCEKWAKHMLKRVNGRRAVVIFDTFQRAIARSKEGKNDGGEMQLAVEHIEAISKSLRGPSITAFHPPKNNANTIAGAGELENSSSAIWTLTTEIAGRKLEVTRIKGERAGSSQMFAMKEIKVAEDDGFGQVRNSVYFERLGGSGGSARSTQLITALTLTKIVVELDKHRTEIAYGGEDGTGPFNLKSLAERFRKLIDEDQNNPICKDWAQGIVQRALEAGLTVEALKTDKNLTTIYEPFFTSGIDLGDGNKLTFTGGKGRGSKRVFNFGPGGAPVPEEMSDEIV